MNVSVNLYGCCDGTAVEGNTVVVFGMTRGGTSMAAGAVRAHGYDLGSKLDVNLEDQDFFFKTDEHMKGAIRERNVRHRYWGWKYPMAADYLERLMADLRSPVFVIVARDVVAATQGLVRWDLRESSAALLDCAMQMQKNLVLAVRWRVPTLVVSYEKASADPQRLISDLGEFFRRPLLVDVERLIRFMQPGSYKSYEHIVTSPTIEKGQLLTDLADH